MLSSAFDKFCNSARWTFSTFWEVAKWKPEVTIIMSYTFLREEEAEIELACSFAFKGLSNLWQTAYSFSLYQQESTCCFFIGSCLLEYGGRSGNKILWRAVQTHKENRSLHSLCFINRNFLVVSSMKRIVAPWQRRIETVIIEVKKKKSNSVKSAKVFEQYA